MNPFLKHCFKTWINTIPRIMKKYKGFWVCEIDADNFSTSSYFGDGEGFPTVGYYIEAESVEEAEKEMKEIWESENKLKTGLGTMLKD